MSWVLCDYHLFLARFPPARPSVESCTLLFSNFSFQSPSLSSICNAISLSQAQPQGIQGERRLRREAFQQFLLEECGFSQSQLREIMTRNPSLFRTKSTDTAQQAFQLLLNSGFTGPQVRKTIVKNPALLGLKVDQQLKPKIDLLTQTVGIDTKDLGHLLSQHPRILGCSLSKNLLPKVLLLLKLFGSRDKLSKAVKRAPIILHCNGVVLEDLENKLKLMESMGLEQEEVKKFLEKDPRFLALSIDKIKKNMEFLTEIAGFSPNIILRYPRFLSYSVERRMNPRHKVFEYLTEMGAAEVISLSLRSMLLLSEEIFAERFLSRPFVAKLYEKYKGKAVDLALV